MTAVLFAAWLSLAGVGELAEASCKTVRTTGYVRTEHGTHTYDGTPIWTPEAIAAASWDIPLGWYVWVEDVGVYRIADRGGGLGSSGWIDVAVWTRAEAFAITGWRTACLFPPDELGATAP